MRIMQAYGGRTMVYKRLKRSIPESREYENMLATVAKQESMIEYVAMMGDVDLPSDSEFGEEAANDE